MSIRKRIANHESFPVISLNIHCLHVCIQTGTNSSFAMVHRVIRISSSNTITLYNHENNSPILLLLFVEPIGTGITMNWGLAVCWTLGRYWLDPHCVCIQKVENSWTTGHLNCILPSTRCYFCTSSYEEKKLDIWTNTRNKYTWDTRKRGKKTCCSLTKLYLQLIVWRNAFVNMFYF